MIGKWSLSLIKRIKKMLPYIENPSEKDLRNFGIIMSIALSLIFLVVLPYLFQFRVPNLAWSIVLLIFLTTIFSANKLFHFHKVWMIFALALNWINTRIILGLVFFTMFLTISIILKLVRKDPMKRSFDKNISSYREIVNEQSYKHMEKPY